MDREQFLTLLTKKISNEISENENSLLEAAIAINAEYAHIANALTEYRSANKLGESYVQLKLEDAWTKIDNAPSIEPTKKIIALPVLLKVAAIVLLVVGAGIWFLTKRSTQPDLSLALMDTIQSEDQKIYTTLDDGTQVTLNRNSSIVFNKEFGKEKRHIILSGEAFFDVTKNEKVPLTIDANNINVEVKGTAFNVSSYKNNTTSKVLLVRGLVEVSNKYNKQNKVLLQPHQMLTAPLNEQKELIFSINTFDTIPVKDIPLLVIDTLAFKKEKLKDIVKQLEKKYKVVIQIRDDFLKERRFSGMFAKETITQALDALKISYPFNYRIEGTEVTIEN